MKLPSKSIMYSKSVFPLFPKILKELRTKEMTVNDLYLSVSTEHDFENFISALDCLYALGRIEINEKEKKLYYVD
jgi:hypothetical protein